MANLFRAEWQKVIGHRWMTGFTLWIFPVGAIGVFATFALLILLLPDGNSRLLNAPINWVQQFLGPWVMFSDVGGIFVRVLPIAFCVSVFAGEFSWGTWKNIVPRNGRLKLIITKYVLIVCLLMLALFITSLIAGGASFLLAALSGQTISPEITAGAVQEFVNQYAAVVLYGFIVIVLMSNYAALASMLTRSLMGGTIAAMGIMVLEEFLLPLLALLSNILASPSIVQFYRLTPTYNLKNMSYWLTVGEPSKTQFFIDLSQPDSLLFSAVILVAWCALSIGLVCWLFKRQDIVT